MPAGTAGLETFLPQATLTSAPTCKNR